MTNIVSPWALENLKVNDSCKTSSSYSALRYNFFTESACMRSSRRFALLILDDMNPFANFSEFLFQLQNINVSSSYRKLPKEIMSLWQP